MRIPGFPAALPIICPAASLTSTSSILYPLITPAIFHSSCPLPSGLKTTGPPLYPALLCPSTSNHDTVLSYFSPLRIPPFVNGNLVLPCSIKKSMAIPSGKPRNLTLWPTVIPPLPTSIGSDCVNAPLADSTAMSSLPSPIPTTDTFVLRHCSHHIFYFPDIPLAGQMLCSNQILSSVDFDCEPSSDDVPDLQVQHPGHDICIHNLIVVCHDSSSNLEHNYRDDEENGERRHSPHNLIHLGAVPGQITFGISPERACTTLACRRGYSSRGVCKMVLLSVRAVSNLRLGVPPAGARGASAAAGCCAAQPALPGTTCVARHNLRCRAAYGAAWTSTTSLRVSSASRPIDATGKSEPNRLAQLGDMG